MAFADHSDDLSKCYPFTTSRCIGSAVYRKTPFGVRWPIIIFKEMVQTIVQPGTGRGHTTLFLMSTEKGNNIATLIS